MKIMIIDASTDVKVAAEVAGIGHTAYQWIHWELKRKKYPGVEVVTTMDHGLDVLLISQGNPQTWENVTKKLKLLGIEPNRIKRGKRPIVVIGGFVSFVPAIADQVADMVCVGEGRNFMYTLLEKGVDACWELPETWVPGEKRIVEPNYDFPWDVPPLKYESNKYRIMCSRGCKRNCLFCQTSWCQPYSEHPNPMKLIRISKTLKAQGKKLGFVTNDLSGLSFGRSLQDASLAPSISFSALRTARRRGIDLKKILATSRIRIGVEGISERLRKGVLKPIKTSDLIEVTDWLVQNHVMPKYFLISGLPGETSKDWEEFKDFVKEIKGVYRTHDFGFLVLSFTAFVPCIATPLSLLPLSDEYESYRKDFMNWYEHGPGYARRVRFYFGSNIKARMKEAKNCMGGVSEQQLRKGFLEGPNEMHQRISFYNYDKLKKWALIYKREMGVT
jgi:radical SAM superfamily enzyme YgiQ (UPF0313 family)